MSDSENKVIDFKSKRLEKIETKRRSFERVLFQNFLGAYSVIKKDDMVFPVTLVDISRDGCLFQVPVSKENDAQFAMNSELPLRMYFTKSSYIPVVVQIKYAKEHKEKDGNIYTRYGCEFDQNLPAFDAMRSFIDFLYKFAEHSSIDRGDARSYFL